MIEEPPKVRFSDRMAQLRAEKEALAAEIAANAELRSCLGGAQRADEDRAGAINVVAAPSAEDLSEARAFAHQQMLDGRMLWEACDGPKLIAACAALQREWERQHVLDEGQMDVLRDERARNLRSLERRKAAIKRRSGGGISDEDAEKQATQRLAEDDARMAILQKMRGKKALRFGYPEFPKPPTQTTTWVEERSKRKDTPRMLPRYGSVQWALEGVAEAPGAPAEVVARLEARAEYEALMKHPRFFSDEVQDALADAKKRMHEPLHDRSITDVTTRDGLVWWQDDATAIQVYTARYTWFVTFPFLKVRERIRVIARELGLEMSHFGLDS